VVIDGVSMVILTERNYTQLRQSPSVTHPKDYCNYSTLKVFSVFPSRCLVQASNRGRSTYSGLPKYTWPQPQASHFSQLQLSTDSAMTELLATAVVLLLHNGSTCHSIYIQRKRACNGAMSASPLTSTIVNGAVN
jgi:hypothetical protein